MDTDLEFYTSGIQAAVEEGRKLKYFEHEGGHEAPLEEVPHPALLRVPHKPVDRSEKKISGQIHHIRNKELGLGPGKGHFTRPFRGVPYMIFQGIFQPFQMIVIRE